MTYIPPDQNPVVRCACGCSELMRQFDTHGNKRRYINGHRERPAPPPSTIIECGCGCGERMRQFDAKGYERQFVSGHHSRVQSRGPRGPYMRQRAKKIKAGLRAYRRLVRGAA